MKIKSLRDLAYEEYGKKAVYKNFEFNLCEDRWQDDEEKIKDFDFLGEMEYFNGEFDDFSEEIKKLEKDMAGIYLFYIKPRVNIISSKYLMYVGKSDTDLRKRVCTYFYEVKRLNKKIEAGELGTINASEYRPYINIMFELWKKHIQIEMYVYKGEASEKEKAIKNCEGYLQYNFDPPLIRKQEGYPNETEKLIGNIF